MAWAFLSDSVPIYPLYALLFADQGLSTGQISSLLLVWSLVGFVAGVPSGALADRFSRRHALAASGAMQAGAYVLWLLWPGYPAFAAGFVLWGLGGALAGGAFEALLFDGLAAAGSERHYPRVYGRAVAAGHLSQVPVAGAATVLFATGGYALVGWASVTTCLAAAALATRLPTGPAPVRAGAPTVGARRAGAEAGYLAVLRSGVGEAIHRPRLRGVVLALAVLGGMDALEELFPLLARDWGVGVALVPLVMLGVPLAGAAGSALGGRLARSSPSALAAVIGAAVVLFSVSVVLHRPAAVAGVAVAYGLYHLVLVVVDARVQEAVTGPARATVTSVAALGTEVSGAGFLVAWASGEPLVVAALAAAVVLALPRLLR